MLNKSYDRCIVGHNYLALAYAIIGLKNEESVLIVDEPQMSFANKWCLNLGQLELNLLKKVGEKYAISPLANIEKYTRKKNTILQFDETILELSDSPFANVRELARKLPSIFKDEYSTILNTDDSIEFDNSFFEACELIASEAHSFFKDEKLHESFTFLEGNKMGSLIKYFIEYLNLDDLENKQVHFILQVLNQCVFSSAKDDFESKFLLVSTISPRYEVNESLLLNDLIFEFRKMGGDLKKCQIKDWGISQNSLNYVLLDTLDGVIKVDKTYIFGNFSDQYPFYSKHEKNKYMSIEVNGLIDHEFLQQFKHKRIVFTKRERMGGDFPFWEVNLSETGKLSGTYCYADFQGSKDTFYYTHCIEDLYTSISEILPGLSRADFISTITLKSGKDTWYRLEKKELNRLTKKNLASLSRLNHKTDGYKIDGIELCSTLRSTSLGLYSYLLDLFS